MTRIAVLFAAAVVLVLVLLRVAMAILVAISLHDTPIGILLTLIANILLAIIYGFQIRYISSENYW